MSSRLSSTARRHLNLLGRIVALALVSGSAACEPVPIVEPSVAKPLQWLLPERLKEVSGLGFTRDGRLFAHDDERAVIYQLDYLDGRIVKTFSLGNPVIRGDFEGIAHALDNFYLVTSDGIIYEAFEGEDGTSVSFNTYKTGTGDRCEIEGLDYDAQHNQLLLACKQMHTKKTDYGIFAWSLDDGKRDDDATIEVSRKAYRKRSGLGDFNPSALALRSPDGPLLLLAARQRAAAEIDRSGRVLRAGRLIFADMHPQPEGLAVASDGTVIIADEGRNGRPRLTVYPPGQDPL